MLHDVHRKDNLSFEKTVPQFCTNVTKRSGTILVLFCGGRPTLVRHFRRWHDI